MPAGLQDWIHALEEGKGTRYIKLFALFLGLIALTVFYDIREYKNFATQEAMDAAQIARNISIGDGFTTKFIRPLSLYLLQNQIGEEQKVLKEKHPDLANPPVYPVILAGLMKVLPFNFDIPKGIKPWKYQPELLITIFNQVLFFTAAILVFFLARRLFDASVAWTSAIVLIGTELLWRFSVSGLSTMFLMVLLLVIVYCMVAMEQNHREQLKGNGWFLLMALLVGGLAGVGGLTRYSFGWLILPIAAFFAIYFAQRRLALTITAIAAFVLVISPWLVRNYNLSGNLFGIAGYAIYQETPAFEGNRLERFLTKNFEVEKDGTTFDHFIRKLIVNLAEVVQNDLPKISGNWIAGLFLVSLLIPFRNPALSRLRIFLVMSLVVLSVVQALGRSYLSSAYPVVNSENLLIILTPLLFIFGVSIFFIFLDQIDLPFVQLRTVISAVFAAVACMPLIISLLPPRQLPFAYPPYFPAGIQDVSRWMKYNELMMSDMPWAIAWYGDRQCVWVTLDAPFDPGQIANSDFYRIYDFQKPVQGLYLTTLTTDAKFFSQLLKNKDFAWGRFMIEALLRNNVPEGFPLRTAPPGFMREGQLFLSDRPRWKTPSS